MGKDHDTARMLARGTPYLGTAHGDPLHLRPAHAKDAVLLVIAQHIAVGRLVLHRADGARLIGLALAEDHLGVGMGLGLIVSCKVQIDIGLLVSLKAQEGLKGDIEAVLYELLSADGAYRIRHVTACLVRIFLHHVAVEVHIVALGAAVMGRQGIYLRDPRHGCHQGGAYGASGAHQIAVVIGIPHQLLGNDIHNGIAVGYDGIQLLIEPDADLRRKLRPVHLVGLLITDLPQGLVGIFDHRRALIRPYGSDGLAHPQDQLRVVDDDPVGSLPVIVPEGLQHLLRGTEVYRSPPLGGFHKVGAFVKILDDLPVNGVAFLREMHVAHSADRFSQLLSQLYDPGIDLHDILPVLHRGLLVQGHIHQVFRRQDLQVVVKGCNLPGLLVGYPPQQRVIELAVLAAGADEESVPKLSEKALWHTGLAMEVIHVGRRQEPVHIGAAKIILGKDRHMLCGKLLYRILIDLLRLIKPVHILDAPFPEELAELQEDPRRGLRIVHGSVVVLQGDPQLLCHRIQLEAVQVRQEHPGQSHRIDDGGSIGLSKEPCKMPDEARIKAGVVSHDHRIPAEVQEGGDPLLIGPLSPHVSVRDAGKLLDVVGNGLLRIHELGEAVYDASVLDLHGADLDDLVFQR